MVIVDTKDVDQEVGKDLDPEHEKAEVEDGRVVVVVSKDVSRIMAWWKSQQWKMMIMVKIMQLTWLQTGYMSEDTYCYYHHAYYLWFYLSIY